MPVAASKFYSLDPSRCAPHMEASFFASLKMPNGTFKLTQQSRFADIEIACAPIIRERSHLIRRVLDIGVSSGITSIELADFLAANGAAVSIVATDLFIDAHIVELELGISVLADTAGAPLQY